MATIRIRGGRREEEEEPDGEEEDEDDGALWEMEEDTRELIARLSAEIDELEELPGRRRHLSRELRDTLQGLTRSRKK
jgi:transposase